MYEIEFHRVGNGDCSGDAITLRYWDGQQWRVGVIDGGYQENGEKVCEHIRKYYETSTVDFVVSTHPDNDHMSGLRVVMAEMDVRQLWLHVPRAHAGEIVHLFKSRRWQVPNLETELKRSYPYVEELIDLAGPDTEIYQPFQGARIGPFTVLSPSSEMYQGLMPQFRDTPQPDQTLLQQLGHWITDVGRRFTTSIQWTVPENWRTETLREGGKTSAENESSVVLLGDFDGDRVLLTGDAGLVALRAAAEFAQASGLQMQQPNIFQVPHHGSRNNISPSMLDYILGKPVAEGEKRRVRCVISAGKEDTTHPRQVVVNALIRRGCEPKATRDFNVIRFPGGDVPKRKDWVPLQPLPFKQIVEEYD